MVVLALHGGLHGALDTQTEASLASSLHVHGEHTRLVSDTALQAWDKIR